MLSLNQPIKLFELAKIIDAELKFSHNKSNANNVNEVSGNSIINEVASIESASFGQVTFLGNSLYTKYLTTTNATAIIVSPKYENRCNLPALLVTDNPRLAFAKLLALCISNSPKPSIHPSCIIGKDVTIGSDVIIEAGAVIGDNCVIGNNTVIKANVVLYSKVTIGNNCIIHSNTVIGSDGFGYAQESDGSWVKVPHLGEVIVEDHVEIGSNTSIDRACIGATLIKKGAIIDNLVQIAHNVTIGEYTAIAGCVAIGGSTTIGNHCLIGGATTIAGHLIITDKVHITGTSTINKSLLQTGVYSSGLPAKDNINWKKNVIRFNNLDKTIKEILNKIKNIEEKIT